MKILEIGGQEEAKKLWPQSEIDTEPNGTYDIILASHVLTKLHYTKSQLVINEWADLLNDGGELHIIVPSLEWACWEIVRGDPSSAVMPHIFGTDAPNLSGFTMRKLRSSFEKADLSVKRARTGQYSIFIGEKEYTAHQHYVMGTK